MLFLTNINLNQNELQNAIIQPLAVPPSNPKLGQIYCNSATSKIMWYNGNLWQTVGVVVEASETNGKIKVDGVEMSVYELPTATASTAGGVKVGSGLKVSADGTLSVDTVNNLTSTDTDKALSAAQGKSLKDNIDTILDQIGEMGGGDMMKATYDTNGDGIVDDAAKLGGQAPSYYAKAADIPLKLSDLTNDEGFIDNTVSNLANYYKKSETYTQGEVNTLIGNLATIEIKAVENLPATGKSNVIYLVPKGSAQTNNTKDEYLWTGTAFEKIGDTEIDLSSYLTKNGNASDVTVSFTQAGTRANVASDEKMSVLLGKIAKYFADLKTVAFSGDYWDLSNKPTIIKSGEFTVAKNQNSNNATFTGTKILNVFVSDSVTGEEVIGDVVINGMKVTVSVSTSPSNALKVAVLYI
jgi:hypothetical protein